MTGKIGTPLYMAPELFEEEWHYGPDVDVYVFSMLAYEIVSGETPFNELVNISPVSLGVKVASGYRSPIPASVPTKIAALIIRCWSHKAEDRPSFSEIFDEPSNDFSMLGESLDEDVIRLYIEMISRREKDLKVFNFNTSNKKLQEEAFKLKKKCHKASEKIERKRKRLSE